MRWAQPGQSNRGEPADRSLGRQAAGCCEGVEAVARKLFGYDVIPDVARIRNLCQQVLLGAVASAAAVVAVLRHGRGAAKGRTPGVTRCGWRKWDGRRKASR